MNQVSQVDAGRVGTETGGISLRRMESKYTEKDDWKCGAALGSKVET